MADVTASRAPRIGVLTDEVANAYSAPILREIAELAHEQNIRLVFFVEWLEPKDLNALRPLATDLACAQNVDAVLILPLGYALSAQDLARYCERFRPLPICSIPDVAANFVSRVSVDNKAGLRAVLRHLMEVHGRRRIAFVRGPEQSDEAEVRYQVYREVLSQHDIPFDEALVVPGHYTVQSGMDAARVLLDERRPYPEAIACANDGMALGVLQELAARGILVPDAIAVTGFDDIEIARYLDPPLTTVRQPLPELGRTALALLLEKLARGAGPEHVILPSALVVRESCGCLAHRAVPELASVPPITPRHGLEALLRHAPAAVAALNTVSVGLPKDATWADEMYGAFIAETCGEGAEFSRVLRAVLGQVAEHKGDVTGLHRAVTVLGQFVHKDLLPGSVEWRKADTLLHAARVRISSIAERTPANQQIKLEDLTYKFTRASSALSAVVSHAALSRVLAEHLPGLGIALCYVAEYAEPGPASEWSQLTAGFDARGPLTAPEGGIRFATRRLWPEEMDDASSSAARLVGPLSRNAASPGFVVFDRGATEGFVFENLFVQIGSVVARLRLLRELVAEVEKRQRAERERLEKELLIAKRIQTGILPTESHVPGLDIAGVMLPATEVGGDYYDVIPCDGGCWIGIGDVAGHGLPTGLVMLMLQSVVSGLVRAAPRELPSRIIPTINRVLCENIRTRMGQDEFVTFSLLRYDSNGLVTYAGAHEDLLVYRGASGQVEWAKTQGVWLGVMPDISAATVDAELKLELGDVLVAYSDGVVEAQNAERELYLPERLAASLARVARQTSAQIRDALLADVRDWMHEQADDITLLVVRRLA